MRQIQLNLPALPKEDIFLVDTCIFSPDYSIMEKINKKTEKLNAHYQVLKEITKNLSKNNNWFTIPEVYEELINPNEYIKNLEKRINDPYLVNHFSKKHFSKNQKKHRNYLNHKENKNRLSQLKEIMKKFKNQRRKTLSLVSKMICNLEDDFSSEQLKVFNDLLPKIEKMHRSMGEKPNDLNTDCKLISTAITYGIEGTPISIYSQDSGLLKTYIQYILENHLDFKNLFSVINGKTGYCPIEKYYVYATIGLKKPIHPDKPLIKI